MKENMIDMIKIELLKLLKIKSIITISMIFALIFGWFNNKIASDQFVPLVATIITFYFAKSEKS